MVNITYAITVCNERWQLERLLQLLFKYLQKGDQVLIQSDSDNVTDDVMEVISSYQQQYRAADFEITVRGTSLNNDFASFKNQLMDAAKCEWIFQIDADEYPVESLLINLQYILSENMDSDLLLVPRINTVDGITEAHVSKWNWQISRIEHPSLRRSIVIDDVSDDALELIRRRGFVITEDDTNMSYYDPVINFPDYQWRLYQNKPEICWKNKVHEVLTGFNSYAPLPADIELCLIHDKDIHRQVSQNDFYETI